MTHNRTLLIMARLSKSTVYPDNELVVTEQCFRPTYPYMADLTLNTKGSCSFSSFTASVHSTPLLPSLAGIGRVWSSGRPAPRPSKQSGTGHNGNMTAMAMQSVGCRRPFPASLGEAMESLADWDTRCPQGPSLRVVWSCWFVHGVSCAVYTIHSTKRPGVIRGSHP